MGDGRDVVAGMQLLDAATRYGFRFQRLDPGPDGPLWAYGTPSNDFS